MKQKIALCSSCGDETNINARTKPERVGTGLCGECFEVKTANPGRLKTCMTCDAKAVLRASDFECKPCRVVNEPQRQQTIRYAFNRRADAFEPPDVGIPK